MGLLRWRQPADVGAHPVRETGEGRCLIGLVVAGKIEGIRPLEALGFPEALGFLEEEPRRWGQDRARGAGPEEPWAWPRKLG